MTKILYFVFRSYAVVKSEHESLVAACNKAFARRAALFEKIWYKDDVKLVGNQTFDINTWPDFMKQGCGGMIIAHKDGNYQKPEYYSCLQKKPCKNKKCSYYKHYLEYNKAESKYQDLKDRRDDAEIAYNTYWDLKPFLKRNFPGIAQRFSK